MVQKMAITFPIPDFQGLKQHFKIKVCFASEDMTHDILGYRISFQLNLLKQEPYANHTKMIKLTLLRL